MPSLLLVEDDHSVRGVLRAMLRGLPFKIREAADGQQALRGIAADPPDVVVLDVLLPQLGGLRVLDALRDQRLLDQIAVVAITGTDTKEAEIRAKGAREVLYKPFTRAQLQAAVESAIRRRRAVPPS